ncbi:hypothetical protein Hanom_Chr03g00188111 [Helianthus anomalus]
MGRLPVYNMLKQSPLGHAISTHVTIYPTLLQEFWWNAETVYRGTSMWIQSQVMGFTIILKEETVTDAFQLGDDPDTTFFPRVMLEETLKDIGYRTPNVSTQINKSGFIQPFQYLVTQLSVYFSKKIGHFNELSYKMMEVVHAVVQEKPSNFSKFLMRNLESNMHTRQPFLIYPRFVTKVITSQLHFGGVEAGTQGPKLFCKKT